jgi:hypothetical protein
MSCLFLFFLLLSFVMLNTILSNRILKLITALSYVLYNSIPKEKKLFAFILFIYFIVLGGGTLWHLQKFFQCIKCIILEFTPCMALLALCF